MVDNVREPGSKIWLYDINGKRALDRWLVLAFILGALIAVLAFVVAFGLSHDPAFGIKSIIGSLMIARLYCACATPFLASGVRGSFAFHKFKTTLVNTGVNESE